MTTKNWLLVAAAVVLGVVYAIFFSDWFQPKTMAIFHTSRVARTRFQYGGAMPGLIFALNHQFKITKIKVVPLAEFETNRNVLPVWYLVASSNSQPVKSFFYGQPMRGLKPAAPGSRAQPLVTNVTYRLLVEAGGVKGQHDFLLK
jgi:hypothetical protein